MARCGSVGRFTGSEDGDSVIRFMQKYGVYYVDREEAIDRFFNSFYGITRSASAEGVDIDQYAKNREAICITGEFGTGKDPMVRLLYSHSTLSHAPLVIIDCAQLHSRGWNFLIENKYSPLTDTDITIHFKNIKALTDKQFLELFMRPSTSPYRLSARRSARSSPEAIA